MSRYIHANALSIGGRGVLIRGASKSGKSTLTLALLRSEQAPGREAVLVGDDRIGIRNEAGNLIARGHPNIAGLIEVRGSGIQAHAYITEVPVVLVVDLVSEFEPVPDDGFVTLESVKLRHLRLLSQDNLEKMLHCITDVLK